ncbi:MAG: hypothetical protein ABIS18_07430 [Actinomycetota bacterium]
MGRGDRPAVRWKKVRQEKKKETEKRKATAKHEVRKAEKKGK